MNQNANLLGTLQSMVTVSLLLATGHTQAVQKAAAADPKPNILMIAVDDLNDWATPSHGARDVLRNAPELWGKVTPNLQRLAGKGMVFENAQCASPACNSSRAALMTSVSPAHSGLMNNDGGTYFRRFEPLRFVTSLPQQLKDHGYRIKTSGKIWHSRHSDAPDTKPTVAEFDRAATEWDAALKIGDAMPPSRVVPRPYQVGGIKWAKILPADGTTKKQLRDGMSDYRTAAWAADEVRMQSDANPLFIACGIFRPHMPWNVPVQYYERFPIEKISIPTVSADDLRDLASGAAKHGSYRDHALILAASPEDAPHQVWKEAIQAYLASVAFADDCIGQLVDAIESKNSDPDPSNDWAVVLWGDHGWHLGEKERWRKFTMWEEATHSTLIAVVPGKTRPGQRVSVPIDYLDIYPTICEVAGVEIPEHCHGRSAMDLLLDPSARADNYAVTVLNDFDHSVRSKRYRYIRFGDQSEEFYDMISDPMALHNLAGEPQVAQQQQAHLKALVEYSRRVQSQALESGYFSSIDLDAL